MQVDGTPFRSIWVNADGWSLDIIDQTRLPFSFETKNLRSLADACNAIRIMQVRGAPLIGVTAAYGVYLAMRKDSSDGDLERACAALLETRPTAVNLSWALQKMCHALGSCPARERAERAFQLAGDMAASDIEINRKIGVNGVDIIRRIAADKGPGQPVNILTHCNAGWLATVDWGTATAPVYMAQREGIAVHVWVDETRPRNQGASLTAWELGKQGIDHTLVVDNVGGHLMQHGMVDLCLVGSDRTTRCGDVCNKIGTYLKALAADDNHIPFYVCLPASTIDWEIGDGVGDIPIEQRHSDEVTTITGKLADGTLRRVRLVGENTSAANYAFDVTPARLVTGLITERAVVEASQAALVSAFPYLAGKNQGAA